MKPLTRIATTSGLSAASILGLLFAGVSLGRLNTPDSAAGVTDYLLYSGLPAAAGMLSGWLSRVVGFIGKVAPAPVAGETASQTVALLGKEAGRLAAMGRTDHARELLAAADKVKA